MKRQAYYRVEDGRRYGRQSIYLRDKREALAGQHEGAEVSGELLGADREAYDDGFHDAREVKAAWFAQETFFDNRSYDS